MAALIDPSRDSGVPGGKEILAFADAAIGPDRPALDRARADLAEALGPKAVPAASAIAATFTKNDRLANGTGIPSELPMLKNSKDIRAELGINDFRTAVYSRTHYPDEM